MFRTVMIAGLLCCLGMGPAASAATLTYTTSGNTDVVTGAASDHAIPWGLGAADPYLSTTYDGAIMFTNLSDDATGIKMLHGSIDSYNVGALLDKLGNVIQTFTFSGNGDQGAGGTALEVYRFKAGTVGGFAFHSGGTPAYEVGGLATVPEPVTWAMMLAGFAMVGLSARRKHRPVVTA